MSRKKARVDIRCGANNLPLDNQTMDAINKAQQSIAKLQLRAMASLTEEEMEGIDRRLAHGIISNKS